MIKLAKTLLAAGLLTATTVSHANGTQFKVVGGNNAELGEWPWMSAVVSTNPNALQGQFCGATLVHHNWAVTAAHCLVNESNQTIDASSIQLLVGAHTLTLEALEPDATRVNITQIIIHPDYDPNTSSADIALLELASRTVNKTARLPDSGTAAQATAGSLATTTGWGLTDPNNSQSFTDVLQEVELPIYNQDDCNTAYGGAIDATMICAGFPAGGKDSCQGDSGGPLVLEVNGEWTLIGVTSFGDGCANAGKPGVYANVMHFRNWIYQQINSLSFDQGHFFYLEGVDQTAQLSRTLLNHSDSDITITAVTLEDTTAFTISNNGCLGRLLTPGQGCNVTVDYIGSNQAQLYSSNITANYGVAATADVGIAAVFALDPLAGLETVIEAPDLSLYSGVNGTWLEDTNVSNNSPSSAKSAAINDSELSALLTYVEGPADISFDLKVSSEETYDGAVLFVNNQAQAIVSGEQDWTTASFTVPAGTHKIWGYYSKDASETAGSDAAYIDNFSTAPPSSGGNNNGGSSGSSSGGGGGGGNSALLLIFSLLCFATRRRLTNAHR